MAKAKRILALADFHCGHRAGLTPPAWQWPTDKGATEYYQRWGTVQRDVWKWYAQTLRDIGKVDICVFAGDAVDGLGSRSGGAEQITLDMQKQVDMAIKCLRQAQAASYRMVYGTAYHTGDATDFEAMVADALSAEIQGHDFFNVNGCIFDVKHHIGNTTVMHGTANIGKQKQANDEWYLEHELQPKSNVLIRAHVHKYRAIDESELVGMTLPALQGFGSKYGVRRCSNVVQIGMILFTIDQHGGYTWQKYLANLKTQRVDIPKL